MRKLALILSILVMGACSSSGKKLADKSYYRFPKQQIVPIESMQIHVKRPSAMGILGNRPMVAQTKDGSLIQMTNNFWLDSPKVLLRNYLQEIFIYDTDKNNLVLNSQILMLEKKHDQALLSIKFSLTNKESQLVFNKTYTSNKTLSENTIPVFVKSIAALLEQMIEQLVTDIQ
jgi:uncharacterized lipoprotein YmbA